MLKNTSDTVLEADNTKKRIGAPVSCAHTHTQTQF